MQCRTNNSDVKLGAYYNARGDPIITNRKQIIEEQRVYPYMSPTCAVIDGRELHTELLANILRIDKRRLLQLSLNPACRIGVENSLHELSNFNTNTRFLYYKVCRCTNTLVQSQNFLELIEQWIQRPSDATDRVVSITYGIEFLLVLELSSDEKNVDQTLKNIQNELMKNIVNLAKIFGYQNLLRKTRAHRIYSNVSSLRSDHYLSDLVQEIHALKTKPDKLGPPLYYNLSPIDRWNMLLMNPSVKKYQSIMERFEDRLFQLTHQMNDSRVFWSRTSLERMGKKFEDILEQNYAEYDRLLKQSITMVEQWQTLSSKARFSLIRCFELSRVDQSQELERLEDELEELSNRMKPIWKTEGLINEFELLSITYIDVSNYLSETDTSLECVREKLLNDQTGRIVICSKHDLNHQFLDRWIDTCVYMIKKRNENPDLRLCYADFSFSQFPLKQIMILPNDDRADSDWKYDIREPRDESPITSETLRRALNVDSRASCQSSRKGQLNSISRQNSSSSSTSTNNDPAENEDLSTEKLDGSASKLDQSVGPPTHYSPAPKETTDSPNNYTNILLVGESGVGKSTFINAIANYLRFSTLDDAMKEPIVIIPVSFLITTGFNFDEHIVTFDKCGNRENERFNDGGQSVTQECQEYEFDVPLKGVRKKIRIIDTPGFGDTRGVEQDEKNVAHIKQFIRRYKSLDAICFLLKPNESRLNIAFPCRTFF